MALALETQGSRSRPEANGRAVPQSIRGVTLPALSWKLAACAAAAVAVLLLQAFAVAALDSGLAVRVILPATMAALLPVAWLARKMLGARVMAAGLILNLAVVVANGGLMPIAPETARAVAGDAEVAQYDIGQRLPGSKDVLLYKSDTRLQPLSDHIVLPLEGRFRMAVSPGDIVVVTGALLFAVQVGVMQIRAALGRRRRSGEYRLEKSAAS